MHKLDLSKFEAVIFDLDSTLTNTHRYPIVATEWLLEQVGVESDELKEHYLRNLFTRYSMAIQAIVEGAPFRSATDIVKTAMIDSLEDIKQPVDTALVDEATHRFKTLHLELSSVQDGVTEILENLKRRKIKLGVLSNSFAGHARIILTNLELIHYFSSVVDCGTVNAFKPMKDLFERAFQDLNTESSKSLYVGDEYYADMVGAKSVGMTTVWINSRERSLEDQATKYGFSTTPDFVLKSIIEFGDLI
ncbi:MAG: HAD family hydrolase [Promethearchaeota archaeon]